MEDKLRLGCLLQLCLFYFVAGVACKLPNFAEYFEAILYVVSDRGPFGKRDQFVTLRVHVFENACG